MKRARFLVLAFLLASLFSAPSFAATKTTVGAACSGDASAADWDSIFQCVGSLWKRAPIQLGSSADACSASTKGLIQWTGTGFQACRDGSNWEVLGSGSTSLLGTSATQTNPQRSDDATTGLYSATASTVSIATGGVQRILVTETGAVAIGTSTPNAQSVFQVKLGADKNIAFNTDTSGGTGFPRISSFNDAASASQPLYINGSYLGLQTNGVERARVDTAGNIGIGTATPTATLDVNGTAKFSGLVTASATPTAAEHLANKAYVDSIAGGGCASYSSGSVKFTTSGSFNPATYGLAPTRSCPISLRVLVMGGGGAGGIGGSGMDPDWCSTGGGGGSGFVIAGYYTMTANSIIPVIVGKAGRYYASSIPVRSGTPSSFGGLTAAGGFGGADAGNIGAGGNGGSGGGGGYSSTSCGTATGASGGTNGANGTASTYVAGYGQGTIVNSSTNIMGVVFSSTTFAAGSSSPASANVAGGGGGINVGGTVYGAGGKGATNGAAGVVYVEW